MSQRKTNMRGPMGHGRMGNGEKAKDFKGAIKKIAQYMLRYKFRLLLHLLLLVRKSWEKRQQNCLTVLWQKLMEAVALILHALEKS